MNIYHHALSVLKSFYAIALFIICISTTYTATIADFINPDGTVTDTIIEILGQTGVRIDGISAKEDWPPQKARITSAHCEKVMKLIQGKDPNYPHYSWRIAANKERWEADNTSFVPEQNIKKIVDLTLRPVNGETKPLNMAAATYPTMQQYDGVLLLGTTLGDFNERVNFLKQLAESKKISLTPASTRIYILTGKRPLNDAEKKLLLEKNETKLLNDNNEKEGLIWVFDQNKQTVLAPFSPVLLSDDHPKGLRATTESTARLFFEQNICFKGKQYLAVSSHIFTLYQYLILKRIAAEYNFQGDITICGTSLETSERSSYPLHRKFNMILDNFARIFYEICAYKKLTGIYPR